MYLEELAYINEEFLRIQEEEGAKQSLKQQSGCKELHSPDKRSMKEILKDVLIRLFTGKKSPDDIGIKPGVKNLGRKNCYGAAAL